MKNALEIFYFSEVQQDTLIQLQPQKNRQNQSLPDINIRRPQLNLERTEEVIRLLELREQEITSLQPQAVRPAPKTETVRKPSIEIDTLLAKYQHIGCSPHPNFPDTFTLTVLERYYQPMKITDSLNPVSDSLQSIIPATTITYPAESNRYTSDLKLEGYPSSVTLFIICGLALLTVIKYNFGRNLPDMFFSFFNYRRALRMIDERRESDRQAALFSDMLFILVTGIFVAVALPFFGTDPLWGSFTWSILFFSAATALLYHLKAWVWNILGVIFKVQALTKMYVYQLFLYNRNAGLAVFPLVAAIPFVAETIAPYMVYSVIAIYIFSFLFRQWRNFQMIHDQNISLFYFILYLCTLEILPLLLFAKSCKVLSEFCLFL